jgi:hypothetical protein
MPSPDLHCLRAEASVTNPNSAAEASIGLFGGTRACDRSCGGTTRPAPLWPSRTSSHQLNAKTVGHSTKNRRTADS